MTIKEKADLFINDLKRHAYSVPDNVPLPSNTLEGDYGTWDDWRDALIKFANLANSPDNDFVDSLVPSDLPEHLKQRRREMINNW